MGIIVLLLTITSQFRFRRRRRQKKISRFFYHKIDLVDIVWLAITCTNSCVCN